MAGGREFSKRRRTRRVPADRPDAEDSSPAEPITCFLAHRPGTPLRTRSTLPPRPELLSPRSARSPTELPALCTRTRVSSASAAAWEPLLLGSLYLTSFSSPLGDHRGSSKRPSLTSSVSCVAPKRHVLGGLCNDWHVRSTLKIVAVIHLSLP